MDYKERCTHREYRTALLEALAADVEMIKAELPTEGLQSVFATSAGGRARIYVTKKTVEGPAVTVCVWERPSGDGSEVTVRCMDDESFTGEVIMTASGPCFRRNDGEGVFPAWGLSENILTPK